MPHDVLFEHCDVAATLLVTSVPIEAGMRNREGIAQRQLVLGLERLLDRRRCRARGSVG